jgi:hypothetical protein
VTPAPANLISTWRRRPLGLGLLALALLLGLLLLAAPATSHRNSGSTWHRGPAGYSAWYEHLQTQGVTVQRWQRPVSELIQRLGGEGTPLTTLVQANPAPEPRPETLVAVLPGFVDPSEIPGLLPWLPDWLATGHQLVVLGVKMPTTAAPFSQTLASAVGPVRVETRRRHPGPSESLRDDYGAVVWQQGTDSGAFTAVATPHLAANAYQSQPGNLALLTALVAVPGGRVWIDEYLHGYRDDDAIAAELGDRFGSNNWLSYLARTPLVILAAQVLIVTLLALIALNRRLGQRRPLPTTSLDNSQAYIQALAGVLHRSGSPDFVMQTLGQAEQLQLQKSLGLGNTLLPIDQLQAAWEERWGLPSPDLTVLQRAPVSRGNRPLRLWLQQLQSLHSPPPGPRPGHYPGDPSNP